MGVSAIFLMLSLDEVAGFHDRVSPLLSPVLGTSGIFTYVWVIPGVAFVVLFLVVYLRFFSPSQRESSGCSSAPGVCT